MQYTTREPDGDSMDPAAYQLLKDMMSGHHTVPKDLHAYYLLMMMAIAFWLLGDKDYAYVLKYLVETRAWLTRQPNVPRQDFSNN